MNKQQEQEKGTIVAHTRLLGHFLESWDELGEVAVIFGGPRLLGRELWEVEGGFWESLRIRRIRALERPPRFVSLRSRRYSNSRHDLFG